MDNLLQLYSKHINIDKLRIHQFSGIILLCGGITNHSQNGPTSVRDYFLRQIKKKFPSLHDRIFLAEEINEWADDMIRERYTPNLLAFESHVSGLASAISLIVESPGSIAELGSFCLLDGVRERLMVVMRDEWLDEKSFISRGPVAHLRESQKEDSNPIHIYSWRAQWDCENEIHLPNLQDLSDHVDSFIDHLKEFESRLPQKPKLKRENDGHISLLITDVIRQFSALKITEIISFLRNIGIEAFDRKKAKGHLFLLEKLDFIKKVQYGPNTYYMPRRDCSFIDYNLVNPPTDIGDRVRFSHIISEAIATDHNRSLAIKKVRKDLKAEGQQ